MASAVEDGSSSLSESAVGDRQTHEVRCVVHNFPDDRDDDDAESTIRSLLEVDVVVRHCQVSEAGLYNFKKKFIRPTLVKFMCYMRVTCPRNVLKFGAIWFINDNFVGTKLRWVISPNFIYLFIF